MINMFIISVMKKKNLLLFSFLGIGVLAGCDNKASVNFSSTKEAFQYLANVKNYTINGSVTKTEDEEISTSDLTIVYTEKAYYFETSSKKAGYKQFGDEGIAEYQVVQVVDDDENTTDKLYISALRKDKSGNLYKNLWSGDFFYSFQDFDVSVIKDNSKGQTITDSTFLKTLLPMTGWSSSYASYVTDASISLRDGSLNIEYVLGNSESGLTYTENLVISNIGTSKASLIEDAVSNGSTYYTLTTEQQAINDAFNGNNYTCYYYSSTAHTTLWGTEKFTDNYYWASFTDAGKEAGYEDIGYVKVASKKDPATGSTLDGIYDATITNDALTVTESSVSEDNPFSNYVSTFSMWDNWHFAVASSGTSIESGYDGSYMVTLNTVAEDAGEHYGLGDMGLTWIGMRISYKNIDKSDMAVAITVYYYYSYTAKYYGIQYYYSDFGTTKETAFDNWFATLTD